MWKAPTLLQLRIYDGLTVLSSLATAIVFLQLIRLGLNEAGESPAGHGLLVGSVWLAVPLLALVMVAVANFPSLKYSTRVWLSGGALLWVLVFSVIPLSILLYR